MTVKDWFADKRNAIDRIVFTDGTVLTPLEIGRLTRAIKGTEGNDTLNGADTQDDILYGCGGDDLLYGNAGEDELYGGEGNDELYGNNGHDLLDGGLGDDYLEGGLGDDTYIWGKGQGNDTIHNAVKNKWNSFIDSGSDTLKLGEGITQEDLLWAQEGNNLVATLKDGGETLTFSNWFANGNNPVDKIEFADGSSLDPAGIDRMIAMLDDAALEVYEPMSTGELNVYTSGGQEKLVIAGSSEDRVKKAI